MVQAVLRLKEAKRPSSVPMSSCADSLSWCPSELQEPLRMVKSYTQLLEQRYRNQLDAEAGEFMQFTVTGVNRMEKFIHDMLLYSQAAEGKTELQPFPAVKLWTGPCWNCSR